MRHFQIPLVSPDAELVESSHLRLKHAKEMLDTDPSQFMYSGEVTQFQSINIVSDLPSSVLEFLCAIRPKVDHAEKPFIKVERGCSCLFFSLSVLRISNCVCRPSFIYREG